ncbi:MAG: flagellar basal body L-ring protein FlgH [Spirochaetota bacterium]
MKFPISTGREYHDSLRSAAFIAALLLFSLGLNAESLWDSDFEGYVADGAALQIGDIISVTVTPNTTLTLTSSHVDSHEGRLSFTGGDEKSLFSFLPQGSSNLSQEIEEESSYTLETEIPVRIIDRDENGLLSLEGTRTVRLNNNSETMRISGSCAAEAVNSQGIIRFNDLYNAVLEYTSPGLERENIITEADLRERQTAESEQPTAGTLEEPATDGAPAAETAETDETDETAETAEGAEGGGQAAAPEYELSEERQRELLLQYFNRFISTLFEPVD